MTSIDPPVNSMNHAGGLKRSPIPFYVQVAGVLRRRIESGILVVNDRLPSLESLASEFGVARVTARQAVSTLEEEGLVWRKQGKGTFVTDHAGEKRWFKLQTEWSALIKLIEGTSIRLLNMTDGVAPPRLSPEDGTPAPNYQYMQRVHSKDGEPYCVIDYYLDKRLYERAPEQFKTQLVLAVLDGIPGLKIGAAKQVLTVGTADLEISRYLGITPDAPVAYVRRLVRDTDGTIIYIGDVVYRGDFIKLDIQLL